MTLIQHCNAHFCCFIALGSECHTYKVLDQADRAMSNTDRSHIKTDNTGPNALSFGWYRTIGKSGTQIPEQCVPTWCSSTHALGWLSGKHPAVKQGRAVREAFFHWEDNCCQYTVAIRVRTCDGYYVYELVKPPNSSLRYRGNK